MNEFIVGMLYAGGAISIVGLVLGLVSFIYWPFVLKQELANKDRVLKDLDERYWKLREEQRWVQKQ